MAWREWLKYLKNDNFLFSPEMRELLFDRRNRAYGAYALRKHYLRNYCRAWAFTYLLTSLLIVFSLVDWSTEPAPLDYMVEVKLDAPPEFVLPKKPTPNSIPKKKLATTTTKNTDLVKVVKDEQEVNEKPKTSLETIDQKLDSLSNEKNEPGLQTGEENLTGDWAVDFADVMPQYPGGQAALARYIHSKLVYPREAALTRIEGIVVVGFIVDSYGRVRQPKVIKSLNPACDLEALRVVRTIPDWIPGKNRGRNVSVQFKLPIEFKLAR